MKGVVPQRMEDFNEETIWSLTEEAHVCTRIYTLTNNMVTYATYTKHNIIHHNKDTQYEHCCISSRVKQILMLDIIVNIIVLICSINMRSVIIIKYTVISNCNISSPERKNNRSQRCDSYVELLCFWTCVCSEVFLCFSAGLQKLEMNTAVERV